jgi:phage recombination protein Bet
MSTEVSTTNGGRTSILATVAGRYGMDPQKFMETLRATAFREVKTNEQFAALLVVANQYRLNPLTKEIFAFPDSKSGGVVPVVGVDGWSRIINEHAAFDGMEFRAAETIVALDGKKIPEWIECVMYRKDRSHPTVAREYADECYRSTGPWKSHPKRMLRHKAMIQAARLAFGFAGIYDPDEAERIIATAEPDVPARATAADRVAAKLGVAAEPDVIDAEVVDDPTPPDEPAAAPIPVDPNGEVIEEDLPGYGADDLDGFSAEQEAAAERKASPRQLAKVAVLMKERETDVESVRKWMQAKWSVSSRSQLDKDQAGQLIEFLSGLPMRLTLENEGAAA